MQYLYYHLCDGKRSLISVATPNQELLNSHQHPNRTVRSVDCIQGHLMTIIYKSLEFYNQELAYLVRTCTQFARGEREMRLILPNLSCNVVSSQNLTPRRSRRCTPSSRNTDLTISTAIVRRRYNTRTHGSSRVLQGKVAACRCRHRRSGNDTP